MLLISAGPLDFLVEVELREGFGDRRRAGVADQLAAAGKDFAELVFGETQEAADGFFEGGRRHWIRRDRLEQAIAKIQSPHIGFWRTDDFRRSFIRWPPNQSGEPEWRHARLSEQLIFEKQRSENTLHGGAYRIDQIFGKHEIPPWTSLVRETPLP